MDLLRNGLLFTMIQPMPDFIDYECVSPSRNLLVKYLVENGASINYKSCLVFDPEIKSKMG